MKFSKKMIIGGFLTIFAVAIPLSIVLPIILTMKKEPLFIANFGKVQSWKIEDVEKQIEEKDNFILFFGQISCFVCKKATKDLNKAFTDNQNDLKIVLKKAKKKNANKEIFYWYYDDGGDDAKKKFMNYLNKIIKKENEEPKGEDKTPFKEIEGTPHILFFKKGKLIAKITGYEKHDKEKFIKKIVANVEKIW